MSNHLHRGMQFGMGFDLGGPLRGMDFLDAATGGQDGPGASSESQVHHQVIADLCQLLGPMVDGNLRDGRGGLNLELLKAKKFGSFESFQDFLAKQAGLDDHKSFRNPYQSLIEDDRFGRLLSYLYRELDPKQYSLLLPEGAADELQALQAELIEIDGEAFARNFSGSKEGRAKLQGLLAANSILSKDQRADLIKGIYQVGDEKKMVSYVDHYRINEHLSPWNYFNLAVTDRELEVAQAGAESILRSMGYYATRAEERVGISSAPEYAKILGGGKGSYLDPQQVDHFKNLAEQQGKQSGAIAQAQAHLAKLWLFAADTRNFTDVGIRTLGPDLSFGEKAKLQKHLLNRSAQFIEQAGKLKSREDFLAFQAELTEFLEAPFSPTGTTSTLDWAKHHAMGTAISDYLSELPMDLRAPLDQLIQLKDSWEYSVIEMEEAVSLRPMELRAQDEVLREKLGAMIAGLERSKHGLWYGYKQHKAISRGISNLADLTNKGDIKDIELAQTKLNSLIYRLSEAESPEDIQAIHEDLINTLAPRGDLYEALVAAEMDGTEHALGLAQTMAEMAALAVLTQGSSLVLQGLGAAGEMGKVAEATGMAAETMGTLSRGQKLGRGFLIGASLATTENALAVATGEVRQGPELVHKWFKDAVATGAAMGVTAGMIPQFSQLTHSEQSLIKNLWARYTAEGLKGVGHLAADTGLEVFEETLDQYLNQALNGETDAISEAEFTELALICMAGGFTKMGLLREQLKGAKVEVESENISFEQGPETVLLKLTHLNTEPSNDNNEPSSQEPKLAPVVPLNPTTKEKALPPLETKHLSAAAAAAVGMTTLLSSELGNAATLPGYVQSISGAGSALANQGFWAGLAAVLGMGALGMMGMAGSRKGTDATLSQMDEGLLALQVKDPNHPDISEHWAIIADQLQEQGDLRGEWIQLALQQNRLLANGGSKENHVKVNARLRQIKTSIRQEIANRFGVKVEFDFSPYAGFELYIDRDVQSEISQDFLNAFFNSDYAFLVRSLELPGFENPNLAEWISSNPSLHRLTSLNLNDNNLDAYEARLLANSPALSNLTSLDLGGNLIQNEGVRALAKSGIFANLRDLNLAAVDMDAGGVQHLASSKTLTRLKYLKLNDNPIGDKGVTALSQSNNFENLTSLSLAGSNLGDEGAGALAASEQLQNLKTLVLRDNYIGPEGAKAMASSRTLNHLSELNLGDNEIEDEGARALASFQGLAHLNTLDLSSNFITASGAVGLAKSSKFINLQALNLEANEIDDVGAEAFAESANFPKLTVLYLGNNPIGSEALLALRKSQNYPNPLALNPEERVKRAAQKWIELGLINGPEPEGPSGNGNLYAMAGPAMPVLESLLNGQPSTAGMVAGALTMALSSPTVAGVFTKLFGWLKNNQGQAKDSGVNKPESPQSSAHPYRRQASASSSKNGSGNSESNRLPPHLQNMVDNIIERSKTVEIIGWDWEGDGPTENEQNLELLRKQEPALQKIYEKFWEERNSLAFFLGLIKYADSNNPICPKLSRAIDAANINLFHMGRVFNHAVHIVEKGKIIVRGDILEEEKLNQKIMSQAEYEKIVGFVTAKMNSPLVNEVSKISQELVDLMGEYKNLSDLKKRNREMGVPTAPIESKMQVLKQQIASRKPILKKKIRVLVGHLSLVSD